MLSVYNKILKDKKIYKDWKAFISSNFCSANMANHYKAVMSRTVAENAGFVGYESGDGKYENEFYTIKDNQ